MNWFRDGTTDPTAQCEIVTRTPSVLVADGHHGLGQLVITRFMEQLIDARRRERLGGRGDPQFQ